VMDELDLFNAVLARKTPEERGAYLDGACQGDDELRAAVVDLLEAYEETHNFLPAVPADGEAPIGEGEGAVIGRYKLLQKLGEGGFGVVYMADQREPVKRRVALKIIKLGMDTRQVIGRFEAERQALAMMEHPNIAKVMDAGATESGRPYFAMELVRGVSIIEFCDEERLSPRDRIELFLDVCSAIQHAHQKGIIHRDIKPSNVLVSIQDDKPVAKVIDFGIAKATQQNLTDKTLFTRFEEFIGTPAYMSPEQMQANASDIDTRSDVYALGVLLYQLLTGHPPFESKDLLKGSQEEMRRRICEELPRKPSTRVTSFVDEVATTIARQRATGQKQLGEMLRGDLDCIVMKALEKDRSRRYESASALARDLGRHLDDEPIEARPPSLIYRMNKLFRRKRGAMVAALVTTIAIVAAVCGVVYGLIQAREGSRIAETEALAATSSAERARATAKALSDMILTGSPYQSGSYTVHEMLLDHQEKLARNLSAYPEIEAKLRRAIAHVFSARDESEAAEKNLQHGLALVKKMGMKEGELAASLYTDLAILYRRTRRNQEAYEQNQYALAIHHSLFGAEHIATLRSKMIGYTIARELDPPIMKNEQLLAGLDKLAEFGRGRIDDEEYSELFLQACYYGVTVANRMGKYDKATRYSEDRMKIILRTRPEHHPAVVATIQHLAETKRLQGELEAAFDYIRDAQARSARWFPDGNAAATVDLLLDEAKIHRAAEDFERMEQAALRALKTAETSLEEGHRFKGDARSMIKEARDLRE